MLATAPGLLGGGQVGARSTIAQSNGAIPSSGTLTAYYPMFIPSDVYACQVELSNSYVFFPNNVNFGDLAGIDVGIYAGNGATPPAPTGSILKSWMGQTIPELATAPWISPSFDPRTARDANGFIVLVVGVPAGLQVGYCVSQQWGKYANSNSINPLPSWAGDAPVMLTPRVRYTTKRPRVVVHCDSIGVGYVTTDAVGMGRSGFYMPGTANNWAMDVLGTPGGTLLEWNDSVLYPYFPAGQRGRGTVDVVQVGVNDLPTITTLADYQALLNAQVAVCVASGARKVVGTTLPPLLSYVAKNTVRLAINTWLLTIPTGLAAVCDVATVVADPGTPSQLLPAYDSGDGDHWNTAGHAAVSPVLATTLSAIL